MDEWIVTEVIIILMSVSDFSMVGGPEATFRLRMEERRTEGTE